MIAMGMKKVGLRALLLTGVAAIVATLVQPGSTRAAESAKGVYLLGFRSSLAGFVPPPGTYFQSDKIYYQGSASANRQFGGAVGGNIINFQFAGVAVASAEAELFLDAFTGTWVSKQQVFGGSFGLSYTQAVGWIGVDASAGASVTGQLGIGGVQVGPTLNFARAVSVSDDVTSYGDPFLTALIGWHAGNFHWNINAGVNVPVGDWEQGRLSNIGFNRWAFDTGVAVTWLDPKKGLEFTVAPGFTFNAENPNTNYKTGTEFHVEFAAMKSLSKKVTVGVTGYHYQQLTGDSGSGARLGDFKGRVTALGPDLKLNLNVRGVPVGVNARWMHEFNVKRRLEGDVGLVSISFPLGVGRR